MSYKEKAINKLDEVLNSSKSKLSKNDIDKLVQIRELIQKETSKEGLIKLIIRLATLVGIILDD